MSYYLSTAYIIEDAYYSPFAISESYDYYDSPVISKGIEGAYYPSEASYSSYSDSYGADSSYQGYYSEFDNGISPSNNQAYGHKSRNAVEEPASSRFGLEDVKKIGEFSSTSGNSRDEDSLSKKKDEQVTSLESKQGNAVKSRPDTHAYNRMTSYSKVKPKSKLSTLIYDSLNNGSKPSNKKLTNGKQVDGSTEIVRSSQVAE